MLNLLILSYHLKVITELIFFHCAVKEVLITWDLMRHIVDIFVCALLWAKAQLKLAVVQTCYTPDPDDLNVSCFHQNLTFSTQITLETFKTDRPVLSCSYVTDCRSQIVGKIKRKKKGKSSRTADWQKMSRTQVTVSLHRRTAAFGQLISRLFLQHILEDLLISIIGRHLRLAT